MLTATQEATPTIPHHHPPISRQCGQQGFRPRATRPQAGLVEARQHSCQPGLVDYRQRGLAISQHRTSSHMYRIGFSHQLVLDRISQQLPHFLLAAAR